VSWRNIVTTLVQFDKGLEIPRPTQGHHSTSSGLPYRSVFYQVFPPPGRAVSSTLLTLRLSLSLLNLLVVCWESGIFPPSLRLPSNIFSSSQARRRDQCVLGIVELRVFLPSFASSLHSLNPPSPGRIQRLVHLKTRDITTRDITTLTSRRTESPTPPPYGFSISGLDPNVYL
jgi:hypothetical protein